MKYGLYILIFYFIILHMSADCFAQLATLQELSHYSEYLQKDQPLYIILPPDYDAEKSYPVLYLLHGVLGNYTNWVEATDILDYANSYQLIIVMPDGGLASWYVDSPTASQSQYESYIVKELAPFIENRYTTASHVYRGICGLSMGGHGAVMLALRHPEVFHAASSLSGVLDISAHGDIGAIWGLDSVLGRYKDNAELWDSYSCYHLIKARPNPAFKVLFDCGDADPFSLEDNQRFAQRCDSLGINYEYNEYPGVHNWSYWDAHIQEHLTFHQNNFLQAAVKRPADDSIVTATASPNPFNAHVCISVPALFPVETTVAIYDSRGRFVKSLHALSMNRGEMVFRWDGATENGSVVSSGLYFAKIMSPKSTMTLKLNFVK